MKPLSSNKTLATFIISLIFALLLLAAGIRPAFCAKVATLTYFKGAVDVKKSGDTKWTKVASRMSLFMKDMVRTGKKSSAEVLLDDGSIIRLKEDSLMEIEEFTQAGEEKKVSLGVKIGKVWTDIAPQPPNSKFEIRGSAAVVGVRGTILAISVDSSQAMRVLVFEGSVSISTLKEKMEEVQSVVLSANQAVNINQKQMFSPEPIKSEEKEEWNTFIKDIEQTKKEGGGGKEETQEKEIKYSIEAENVNGEIKETKKYSIPVRNTGGETK